MPVICGESQIYFWKAENIVPLSRPPGRDPSLLM
jgi:hypothetical protein